MTSLFSDNSGASNFTIHVPAVNGVMATVANINTALPSGTSSQLYGGTGAAGAAAVVTVGTGLSLSGGTLSATGSGAVASVSNSDGTLTISPTTGAVVASINLSHNFTWAGSATFSGTPNEFKFNTVGAGAYYDSSTTANRFFAGTDTSTDVFRIYAAGYAGNAFTVNGASGQVSLSAALSVGAHVTMSGLVTSGTVANSVCTDSSGNVIAISGTNCFAGGGTAGVVTKTGSYTLNSAEQDNNTTLEMNCSSACTLTIPSSPTHAYPVAGFKTDVVSVNLGTVTIVGSGSSVVVSRVGTTILLAGEYSGATIYNGSTGTANDWVVVGDIVP